ncbi:flagella basal body P-ring formation protein FlgA [Cypionkella aquatica]|uniref:Flagella basal body P-ring formation protein FlgA n=1 Tax=Cypionkella aquatica TaxID=1756042 RepID=A0AA37WZX1_9RHOB|nr:flagellar basal body P-ring formation chaperone FlgA [Cypionkella aquatica]GLS85190.1 flagella basal body P-ring formation protein FlgA [Cypionkella aquatica]
MWRFLLIFLAFPALADSVVATRTIRAHSLLTADDMTLVAMDIQGALTDTAGAIGQETRVAIYAGKPIHADQIGPNAIVERNQIVPLSYSAGGLSILTEGRALARGGVGETIEVMNLSSRAKVAGLIGLDGVLRVGPSF